MLSSLFVQLVILFSALSGAVINVCDLTRERRQQLNVSCNFNTKEGCTALFTSKPRDYWKYEINAVGNPPNGRITGDHTTDATPAIVVAAEIEIGTTTGAIIVTEDSMIPAPSITPDTKLIVNDGAPGGYYLLQTFQVFPKDEKYQLLTPFLPYNNVCLRFWYNLLYTESNIKVIANNQQFFSRNHSKTHGWEQKNISISLQTHTPIQIAFESHKTHATSYVGIDDVVIEIERSASNSKFSTTTTPRTLPSSRRNASSITNSTKTVAHISTTSTITTSTLSKITNPKITSKPSTTRTTPVTSQTAKSTTRALNTKSATTATKNIISTPKATFIPTKTSTSSTLATAISIRTTKTPMKTSTTSATTALTSTSPTTKQSTKLTTTSTTTRFKSSTRTRPVIFTKPLTTVSGAVINVCNLPSDKRQQLNVSCSFNSNAGCTALYSSKPRDYWKYETKGVGTQWDGRITGDHNTGGSGGYYILNLPGKEARYQLLTPVLPYNNICLRFWYNLPSTESNIKVLANNQQLFSRGYNKTHGWEQKNIYISLQTHTPIQIAFESHKTHATSYVGIDDVIIEIERSASNSKLSTTTTPRTLPSSRRNASSITNSTKTVVHTSTTSTITTSTLSKITNPKITSKPSTTRTTPVTSQTAKSTTRALNTKSATTATKNIISTPKATFIPTKTSTSSTLATAISIRTTKTPMKTSTTSATTALTSTSPTTKQSTKLTNTSTTTRFKYSTRTRPVIFTKPLTTVSGAIINVCDLPRERRQQLNVSCSFNTKEGCTALYTSKPSNSWKYETKEVGHPWDGRITGDHNTGGSSGYYLLNLPGKEARYQLLAPFLPYNNICLRFWYNLPSTESNIKVLANNQQLFKRGYSKTQGWEQKNISISLQTHTPIQIVFESNRTHTTSYVGIDEVIIEIERSASNSTLSTTTIQKLLPTSRRNASPITNSTKTVVRTSTTSTVTTATSSRTINPKTTPKPSKQTIASVISQTAKATTRALNTKSATTAIKNIISTPRATVIPTKTSTTTTLATFMSVRTIEQRTKTSKTSANTTTTTTRPSSPTTKQSTKLTTTLATTRFKSSTRTRPAIFTKPLTTVSGAVINVCDLPRERRQKLNISCNFNTTHGCTVLYTSKPSGNWKYETRAVGNQTNGRISGDHNTGRSHGYYLFQSLKVSAREARYQLVTPFLPYNNICLRFWYNLPSTESNIKVRANNQQFFSRDYYKTHGWEEKTISISLQTHVPIQIAFESHTTHHVSYVGIDDVVIEIDGSASKFTLSSTTTHRTLTTSRRNVPSITNSTKTAPHTAIASAVITSKRSKTTNHTTSKLNTTTSTPVTTQTAKTTTMASNNKSATTATQNIISTSRAPVIPTKMSTTTTSATTKSIRTTETPIKTPATTISATTKSIRTSDTYTTTTTNKSIRTTKTPMTKSTAHTSATTRSIRTAKLPTKTDTITSATIKPIRTVETPTKTYTTATSATNKSIRTTKPLMIKYTTPTSATTRSIRKTETTTLTSTAHTSATAKSIKTAETPTKTYTSPTPATTKSIRTTKTPTITSTTPTPATTSYIRRTDAPMQTSTTTTPATTKSIRTAERPTTTHKTTSSAKTEPIIVIKTPLKTSSPTTTETAKSIRTTKTPAKLSTITTSATNKFVSTTETTMKTSTSRATTTTTSIRPTSPSTTLPTTWITTEITSRIKSSILTAPASRTPISPARITVTTPTSTKIFISHNASPNTPNRISITNARSTTSPTHNPNIITGALTNTPITIPTLSSLTTISRTKLAVTTATNKTKLNNASATTILTSTITLPITTTSTFITPRLSPSTTITTSRTVPKTTTRPRRTPATTSTTMTNQTYISEVPISKSAPTATHTTVTTSTNTTLTPRIQPTSIMAITDYALTTPPGISNSLFIHTNGPTPTSTLKTTGGSMSSNSDNEANTHTIITASIIKPNMSHTILSIITPNTYAATASINVTEMATNSTMTVPTTLTTDSTHIATSTFNTTGWSISSNAVNEQNTNSIITSPSTIRNTSKYISSTITTNTSTAMTTSTTDSTHKATSASSFVSSSPFVNLSHAADYAKTTASEIPFKETTLSNKEETIMHASKISATIYDARISSGLTITTNSSLSGSYNNSTIRTTNPVVFHSERTTGHFNIEGAPDKRRGTTKDSLSKDNLIVIALSSLAGMLVLLIISIAVLRFKRRSKSASLIMDDIDINNLHMDSRITFDKTRILMETL